MTAILGALFLVFAPLPFLSQVREGSGSVRELPHMVLRFGQDLARPSLVDVTSAPERAGWIKVKIDGVGFVLEMAPGMLRDEFEAAIDSVAEARSKRQFTNAKRVRFEGWEPPFLPLRIQYRYLFLAALASGLFGLYLILTRASSDGNE